MKIADQVAMVTGGGSGLGRAMALGLARAGARLLIAEVRESAGKKALDEIRAAGGVAELFLGDISQTHLAEQAVSRCVSQFRKIDILINNAGIRMEERDDEVFEVWRCLRQRPVHELPIEEWDRVLNVNLRAVFLCTRFALPHMIRQGSGTIIGISSNAGHRGVAGKSAYCASKHAVEGLMKTVAAEVCEFGISANAIHPGGRVDVDGRGGFSPDMIVPVVHFLASQSGPEVTGQTISAKEWNRTHSSVPD